MYRRSTDFSHNSGEYSLPPGYDGSRFRRRHRDNNGVSSDEVVLVLDSDYASVSQSDASAELSVGGIPTDYGLRERKIHSTSAKDDCVSTCCEPDAEHTTEEKPKSEKLSGILDKLGFGGGMSADELLICAIIFLIASDRDNEGRNAGDILLILALLLGIR